MKKRALCVGVAIVCLTACGGGSPSGPSNNSIPNVTGTYTGNVTLAFPELGTSASVVCPGNTAVTQSGTNVSIAPLVLGGQCGNLSIPFGQVTIDATGAFPPSGSVTVTDPSCGTYTGQGSGGFFGRELRISMSATSRTCYNFNFTATLTR